MRPRGYRIWFGMGAGAALQALLVIHAGPGLSRVEAESTPSRHAARRGPATEDGPTLSPFTVLAGVAASETPTATPTPPPAPSACAGDCDGNGAVSVAELVLGVGILLEERPPADCPAFDGDGDGRVAVHELVRAVLRALDGCTTVPPPSPTASPPATPCEAVEIRVILAPTGLIPGSAEARFRERDDCRRDLRVQLEDVPAGRYVLVAGGSERASVEVGVSGQAEIELAAPPQAGEPLLDFDPRGMRLQILRRGEVAFSRALPSEGSLVVVTYNVAGLPEGISGSHPSVNTVQISPLLNAFDLVLVQEDFCFHRDLISGLRLPFASPPEHDPGCTVFVGPERDIGDGLNRFSRTPFSAFVRFDWATCNGATDCSSDCLTEKGFTVAAHVLGPGAEADVYNLHMDAGSCAGDQAARSAQVEQLLAEIAARSAGRAVIVAGDTNLKRARPGDGAILDRLLDGAGLTDACAALACGDDRIDRVLLRSGAAVRLEPVAWWIPGNFTDANGDPLSDHDPVAVRVRWEAGGAASP